MNRAEVIESVKAIKRTCRGRRPENLPEKLRVRLEHALEQKDGQLFEKHCKAAGLPLQCGMRLVDNTPPVTIPQLISALLEEGENDLASKLDKAARVAWCRENLGRDTCGQDVNEMICASKLDGTKQQCECPTCGTVITFIPPAAE